jgi:hypothetical protein
MPGDAPILLDMLHCNKLWFRADEKPDLNLDPENPKC